MQLIVGLIERLQRGETDALGEVYALFNARLYSYLRRMARNDALAADLTQETWVKVAKSVHGLQHDTKLEAWVFAIARNTYLSQYSRHRTQRKHAMIPVEGIVPNEDLGLLRALDALPQAERELLLLIADTDLSLEAVAEMMNISYAALRKRLSRAREALSDQLRHEGVKTP